jgi:hypothetical protein
VSRFQQPGPEQATPGAWLASGERREGSGRTRRIRLVLTDLGLGLRGGLAAELAVDEPQDPRGAGLLAARVVEAGEGGLRDSQL